MSDRLPEVVETSEPNSHNSVDLESRSKDDPIWKEAYQNTSRENDHLRCENLQLRSELEHLIEENNLLLSRLQETHSLESPIQDFVQDIMQEVNQKVEERFKNRFKQPSKETNGSLDSLEIKNGEEEFQHTPEREFRIRIQENSELIDKLREELIRSHRTNIELKVVVERMRQECRDKHRVAVRQKYLEDGKGSEKINWPGHEEIEFLRTELESERKRNYELDRKLEDIYRQETLVNCYYQENASKGIGLYKELYCKYLRKKKFLAQKENRILSVIQKFRELEIEHLNDNPFWSVVFVITVLVVCTVIGLFIYQPQLIKSDFL